METSGIEIPRKKSRRKNRHGPLVTGSAVKVTNLLLQTPSLCDRQRGVRREREPVVRLVVSANQLPGKLGARRSKRDLYGISKCRYKQTCGMADKLDAGH